MKTRQNHVIQNNVEWNVLISSAQIQTQDSIKFQVLNLIFNFYNSPNYFSSDGNFIIFVKMKTSQKKWVTTWLYTGLILVAFMVVIGGITRLTHSGLSMVEWKLIGGAIPPLHEIEWEETFAKYQQFPEYQKINKGMSLSEFKSIFFWEYLHRVLGRLIGMVFIIPFVIFWFKKWFNNQQKKQLLILLALGALQGFLGWFMVKSGLADRPSVSHYRLAIHLVAAFTVMCYIYWLILSFNKVKKYSDHIIHKWNNWLIGALLIQIIYGAFVAGLKAGYFLQTNDSYLKNVIGYNFRNNNDVDFFNNPIDIQFFHRAFAWVVFILAIIIYKKTRKSNLTKVGTTVLGLVLLQIALGITTLLLRVQISLAITHQFIAIVLLLSAVRLSYLSGKNQIDL